MSKGLYAKYVVHYAHSGRPVDGFCFVLRPERDYAARKALRLYAKETLDFRVARDLNAKLAELERNSEVTEDD